MGHYRAVVFDLDGTLLDTVQDIAEAVNRSLAAFGWPEQPLSLYRKLVGAGLGDLLFDVLGPYAHSDSFFKAFREHVVSEYALRLTHKTEPYPGICALLGELCHCNIPRAVLSNKAHDKTIHLVDHYFRNNQLNPVLGAREGQPLKPEPTGAREVAKRLALDPDQLLYVGDTPSDMETARRAGMLPLGVSWGFRPENELKESGAFAILREPAHVWDYLSA